MRGALRKDLASDDPERRRRAAEDLGGVLGSESVEALTPLLGDPDLGVRRAAARALGRQLVPEAAEALAGALWDLRSFIQAEAAEALVTCGGAALQALQRGLSSPEPAIREVSRSVLTRIVGPEVAEAWCGMFAPQGPAAQPSSPRSGAAVPDAPSAEATSDEGPDGRMPDLVLDRLCAELESHDADRMQTAARRLCASRDWRAWDALVAARVGWGKEVLALGAECVARLAERGEVGGLSAQAAEPVLEKLQATRGAAALAGLRSALAHRDPHVRSQALQALDRRGVPADSDEERRVRALHDRDWERLRALGPGPVLDLLLAQLAAEDDHDRAEAAAGLGELGDPGSVEPLLDALDDDDECVRRAAIAALARLGDRRAVAPLIARLDDPEPDVREEVADALGLLRDPTAVPALGAALDDLERRVRASAAKALGAIGDPSCIPVLGRGLDDTDPEVRRSAVEQLARIGSDAALASLLRALADEVPDVRAAAAVALAGIAAGREARAPLVAALRDADAGVRAAAAQALAEHHWTPETDDDRAWLAVARGNVLEAAKYEEAGLPALICALGSPDTYAAEVAAQSLGLLMDPRALDPLIGALRGAYLTVRATAAWALGRLRCPEALAPLVEALRDREAHVRRAAAEALGVLGDARAAGDLRAALDDPDGDVAKAGAEALQGLNRVRPKARLAAALRDDDPKIALRAAYLLAREEAPAGLDWLEHASQGTVPAGRAGEFPVLEEAHRRKDSVIVSAAIDLLDRLPGRPALEALVAAVENNFLASDALRKLAAKGDAALGLLMRSLPKADFNPRYQMLIALGRMGPIAWTALTEGLRGWDAELKKTAAECLGRVEDPAPLPPLEALAGDPDPEVARVARHYLDRLRPPGATSPRP